MTIESALNSVAASLGVKAKALYNLIYFESRFNPLARNTRTGARGLIQFMHSTAQGMGFKSADDLVSKYPDIESQLRGPVLSYLSKYKPFPSDQSLYMAVFYPVYRFVPQDTAFPDTVTKQNPGIRTVRDYVDLVERRKFSAFYLLIPISAIALMYVLTNYPKEAAQWIRKMITRKPVPPLI